MRVYREAKTNIYHAVLVAISRSLRLREATAIRRQLLQRPRSVLPDEMKIVFLAIDGVLNCNRTPNPRKFPFIVDAVLLKRLERLLAKTGADVVLTSDWRFDPVGVLAAEYYHVPFTDVTPDLPGEPRCNPIAEWFGQHPDVERFT